MKPLTIAVILTVGLAIPFPSTRASAQPPPGQQRPGAQGQPAPGQAGAPAPETKNASISGRVFAGDTGSPLRNAEVQLISRESRTSAGTTTDDEGRFEFTDLAGGRYAISASKGGYVRMTYGQKDPLQPGRPVELAASQHLDKLDITLPRGGVITGTILDSEGEPVTGVMVMAMRYRYVQGARRLVPSGRSDQTDDRGMYRVYGLPPGSYCVMARGRRMRVNAADKSGYTPTYYPGTPDVSMAGNVPVQAGQEASGITFALASTRTATISGTVLDSSGRPAGNQMVLLTAAQSRDAKTMVFTTSQFGRTKPDGTFRIAGIAPGRYVLIARNMINDSDALELGTQEITVAGDLSGITISMTHGTTLSGTVVIDGGRKASFDPRVLTVMAHPPIMAGMGIGFSRATVGDDWTFNLKGLSGTEELSVMSLPAGWTTKAIRLNGDDITDSGVDVSGHETMSGLQIVLTDRVTDVNGIVTDESNKPLTDYALVVFPTDQTRWGRTNRYTRTTRPDQNGRFDIKGLPPGEYYAVAVASLEEGADSDPDVLQQLVSRATKFSLREGESKTLNLVAGGEQ